jgi:glycosyltransferase involved in cell wall biosynthesis
MNKTGDLVSVILSVYNSEKTIEECLNSLLSQTYKNIEILVIDDGSKDSSLEICKSYENKNKQIEVYENKNNIGLTKSLNKLLIKSRGELIARQDADDISSPERLEKQVQFLIKEKIDACTTRSRVMQTNMKRPGISFYLPNKILIKIKNPFIHGTLLIKKNVIKDIGFYDERFYYAQDYKLFTDLIRKGYKVKTMNQTLYSLNIKNNISSDNLEKQNHFARCVRNGLAP